MLVNEGATPDAEAVDVPKSMDDTIRETLRSLKEGGAEIETPTEEPVTSSDTPKAPEDAEQKAQRIRDEKGKFAKAGHPPEEGTVAVGQPAPETPPPKPSPKSLKKELADKHWATLDPELQDALLQRDEDFAKGIEGYKTDAQFGKTLKEAIGPYMATINSLGVTPDKAVAALMNADHRLRYGTPQDKQQTFAQLAQQYGIDLAAMPAQAEQTQIDPTISALQQQVQELRGYLQNQQQTSQQQAEQTLTSEITAFAADPKHSHFESVKGHMASLLQAGLASSLSDAYEQAIYANPVTRQAVLAQQQEAARKESAEKAQAARTVASVNTRARPSLPVSPPIGSMDDTIRSTLRRLQGT